MESRNTMTERTEPVTLSARPDAAAATLNYEGTLRVQGYDINMAGIVHNTVFIRWLEDLRTGWCDRYLPLSQQVADGYLPIVTSTEIEYKTPIRFGDSVTGKLRMTAKRVRWVADMELWNGTNLAARARQTGAFVGLVTLKPIPIPAQLTAALTQVVDRESEPV